MGNLYSDNIEDRNTYSDQDILKDVRALISTGYREGALIDYKKDISDKDNWPEAAAAFANTFGGLIIFGVDEQQGLPIQMTGFDPRGVETHTRLVSILLSRVQPRLEYQIRIVNLDTDKTKELALIRVPEGLDPPYLHSKQGDHRVYIRMGAQKAEADYLQLNALIEKRKRVASEAVSLLADLSDGSSPLRVHDPPGSNQNSRHFYRFILVPEDSRAARRLTLDVEREFARAVERMFGNCQSLRPESRTRSTTCFRCSQANSFEQRFAISTSGSIGFVSHACLKTDKGFFFVPALFCQDLINFLSLTTLYHERTRYYGSGLLDINLSTLDGAHIYAKQKPFESDEFFEPPLSMIRAGQIGVQARVLQHPITPESMQECLENAWNDMARNLGHVVNANFGAMVKGFVNERVDKLRKP